MDEAELALVGDVRASSPSRRPLRRTPAAAATASSAVAQSRCGDDGQAGLREEREALRLVEERARPAPPPDGRGPAPGEPGGRGRRHQLVMAR